MLKMRTAVKKIRIIHPAIGELAFPLQEQGRVVIGRKGESVGIELNWDVRISRRHAMLRTEGGQVWFEDLNSRNGSWHGEERLDGPVRLEPGMSIIVGETVLLLPETDDPDEKGNWTAETTFPNEEIAVGADLQQGRFDIGTDAARAPEIDILNLDTQSIRSEGPSTGSSRPITYPLADDLSLEPLPKPQVVVERSTERSAPRFLSPQLVAVDLENREAFEVLWQRDLVQGGLFVTTATPPAFGTKINIRVVTPEGEILLQASVVHVVDENMAKQYKMSPGVGLQLVDLSPETQKNIEDYLTGTVPTLVGAEATPAGSSSDAKELVERARTFMQQVDERKLYTAIGIEPTAIVSDIRMRIRDLRKEYTYRPAGLLPPQTARLDAALNILTRVEQTLTDGTKRLKYDFSVGEVRAEERLEAARSKTGPAIDALREAWNIACPSQTDRSAILTREAFAARQSRKMRKAIELGKDALEHNPFFEELRQTVEAWKTLVDRESGKRSAK